MSQDNGIVWEEPPVGTGSKNKKLWESLLEPLMEHPERWARVREMGSPFSAASAANKLNRGKLSRPAGRWEFCSRGKHVYARYLGPA